MFMFIFTQVYITTCSSLSLHSSIVAFSNKLRTLLVACRILQDEYLPVLLVPTS